MSDVNEKISRYTEKLKQAIAEVDLYRASVFWTDFLTHVSTEDPLQIPLLLENSHSISKLMLEQQERMEDIKKHYYILLLHFKEKLETEFNAIIAFNFYNEVGDFFTPYDFLEATNYYCLALKVLEKTSSDTTLDHRQMYADLQQRINNIERLVTSQWVLDFLRFKVELLKQKIVYFSKIIFTNIEERKGQSQLIMNDYVTIADWLANLNVPASIKEINELYTILVGYDCYTIAELPATRQPDKGKIYLEQQDDRLSYHLLDLTGNPSSDILEGFIDIGNVKKLNVKVKFKILESIAAKGQILYPILGKILDDHLDLLCNAKANGNAEQFETIVKTNFIPLFNNFHRHHQEKIGYQYISMIRAYLDDFVKVRPKISIEMLNSNFKETRGVQQYECKWLEFYDQLKQARTIFNSKSQVLGLEKTYADKINELIRAIIQHLVCLLGEPPCGFHLLSTGSFSRGNPGPYSDIELALLSKTANSDLDAVSREYFDLLLRGISYYFQLISGDWTLIESGQYDTGTNKIAIQLIGMHVDKCIFEKNAQSIGWKKILLDTPENMAGLVSSIINSCDWLQGKDAKTDAHTVQLLYPTSVYFNAPGEKLFENYCSLIMKTLTLQDQASMQTLCRNLLQSTVVKSKGALACLNGDKSELNVKDLYLTPIIYFLLSLGLKEKLIEEGGIKLIASPYKLIELLKSNGVISAPWADELLEALIIIHELRNRYQLRRGCQAEDIVLKPNSQDITKDLPLIKLPVLEEKDYKKIQEIESKILKPLYRNLDGILNYTEAKAPFDPIILDFNAVIAGTIQDKVVIEQTLNNMLLRLTRNLIDIAQYKQISIQLEDYIKNNYGNIEFTLAYPVYKMAIYFLYQNLLNIRQKLLEHSITIPVEFPEKIKAILARYQDFQTTDAIGTTDVCVSLQEVLDFSSEIITKAGMLLPACSKYQEDLNFLCHFIEQHDVDDLKLELILRILTRLEESDPPIKLPLPVKVLTLEMFNKLYVAEGKAFIKLLKNLPKTKIKISDTFCVSLNDPNIIISIMRYSQDVDIVYLVQGLLDYGIDLNKTYSSGYTPLDVAISHNLWDISKILVEAGAGIKLSKKHGEEFINHWKDQDVLVCKQLLRLNLDLTWHLSLAALTQEDGTIEHFQVKGLGLPYLRPEIQQQIFGNGNKFPTDRNGRGIAKVRLPLIIADLEAWVHFKAEPEFVGNELLVTSLANKLFDDYITPHIAFCVLTKSSDSIIKPDLTYKVLLSRTILGETLEETLQFNPERLKQLDPESVSKAIILAILINQEDGNASNYIVEPTCLGANKSYRLISIDNDHAFVPPLSLDTEQQESVGSSLQVKTILFCLEQMQEEVHPAIRASFKDIDIYKVLQNWLIELQEQQKQLVGLFGKEEQDIITITRRSIMEIYYKLHRIQALLEAQPQISMLELLINVSRSLGLRYKEVFVPEYKSVRERFDALTKDAFYKKDLALIWEVYIIADISSYKVIPNKNIILLMPTKIKNRYVVLFIKNGELLENKRDTIDVGLAITFPIQGMILLTAKECKAIQTIKKEILTRVGLAQSSTSTTLTKPKQFLAMLKQQGAPVGLINALKDLQRFHEERAKLEIIKQQAKKGEFREFATLSDAGKEEIFNELDFTTFTATKLTNLYVALKGARFVNLCIENGDSLTDTYFIKLLQIFGNNLKGITLRGCQKLTILALKKLVNICPDLESLTIDKLNLQNVENINFRSLRVLRVKNCGALKVWHINAPNLDALVFENCTQLHTIVCTNVAIRQPLKMKAYEEQLNKLKIFKVINSPKLDTVSIPVRKWELFEFHLDEEFNIKKRKQFITMVKQMFLVAGYNDFYVNKQIVALYDALATNEVFVAQELYKELEKTIRVYFVSINDVCEKLIGIANSNDDFFSKIAIIELGKLGHPSKKIIDALKVLAGRDTFKKKANKALVMLEQDSEISSNFEVHDNLVVNVVKVVKPETQDYQDILTIIQDVRSAKSEEIKLVIDRLLQLKLRDIDISQIEIVIDTLNKTLQSLVEDLEQDRGTIGKCNKIDKMASLSIKLAEFGKKEDIICYLIFGLSSCLGFINVRAFEVLREIQEKDPLNTVIIDFLIKTLNGIDDPIPYVASYLVKDGVYVNQYKIRMITLLVELAKANPEMSKYVRAKVKLDLNIMEKAIVLMELGSIEDDIIELAVDTLGSCMQEKAAEILYNLGQKNQNVIKILEKRLNIDDDNFIKVANVLSKICPDNVILIDILNKKLQCKDKEVCFQSALILAEVGQAGNEVSRTLLSIFDGKFNKFQCEKYVNAAKYLGKSGKINDKVLDKLIEVLRKIKKWDDSSKSDLYCHFVGCIGKIILEPYIMDAFLNDIKKWLEAARFLDYYALKAHFNFSHRIQQAVAPYITPENKLLNFFGDNEQALTPAIMVNIFQQLNVASFNEIERKQFFALSRVNKAWHTLFQQKEIQDTYAEIREEIILQGRLPIPAKIVAQQETQLAAGTQIQMFQTQQALPASLPIASTPQPVIFSMGAAMPTIALGDLPPSLDAPKFKLL